jgi:hypothetical protein
MVHCCLVDNEHASDDHPYGDSESVRLSPVHIDLVVVPGNLLSQSQLETTQESLKRVYDSFCFIYIVYSCAELLQLLIGSERAIKCNC